MKSASTRSKGIDIKQSSNGDLGVQKSSQVLEATIDAISKMTIHLMKANETRDGMAFKMGKNTTLGDIFKSYSDRVGVPLTQVRLGTIYIGTR